MKNQIRAACIAAIGMLAVISIGGQGAVAADGDGGASVLPMDRMAGVELLNEMPAGGASIVPVDVRSAVAALESGPLASSVNNVAWDEKQSMLTVFVHGDTTAVTEQLSSAIPSRPVKVVAAQRASEMLHATVEKLAGASRALLGGATLSFAEPSLDGSHIRVGVQLPPLLDLGSLEMLLPAIDGVDLVFEIAPNIEPVIRRRTSAPVYTGGYMAGQGSACTTGFPVVRSDGQYGNLSADHCGKAVGGIWGWGSSTSSVIVGTASGTAPGDSDFEVFTGTSAASGYSLVGAYNVSNSITPIRGYYNAIVGDKVCYNGSFSGTVCSNTVQGNEFFTCYAGLQCYWLVRTLQDAGTPAAGNGDSGGPVMAFALGSNGTLGGYGTGIISGISGGTATCTGEPGSSVEGERKCSANVLFAPLDRFINTQSNFTMVTGPQT